MSDVSTDFALDAGTTSKRASEFDYTVVYDTYCGWSYGASDVLDAVVNSGAKVRVLHRYLFQGDNAPMLADGYAEYMDTADARIEALSGAHFSEAYAKNVRHNHDEHLESGLTADAALLVHELGPQREFEFYRRLQSRRFIDGISSANRDDIVAELIEFGVPAGRAELIGSPELRAQSRARSADAHQAMLDAGAQGVPALIDHTQDRDSLIEVGEYYANPSGIVEAIRSRTTNDPT